MPTSAARPMVPAAVELSSADLTKELDRISEAAKNLSDTETAAKELRESLPLKWIVVRSEDRGQEEVSAEGLRAVLLEYESKAAHRKVLQEQLLARVQEMKRLGEELEREEGTARPSADAKARSKLEEILKRKEFGAVAPPGLYQVWREKIINWLYDHLGWLLRRLFGSQRAGETAVWVLVAVAFLFLAVWLGRHLARSRLQMFALDPPPPAGKSWREWAREALAAAREGRHRQALHAAYWAGVYRLEELGAWKQDRAKTPREYLRMLRAQPPKRTAGGAEFAASAAQMNALAALTERFELTWYGYREAGEGDFRHAVEQLEALGCRLS